MEHEDNEPSQRNHLEAGGNIILLGAMGSGKTTVGWLLSRLVGFGFVDLDTQIEKAQGQSIAKVFETLGETKFREMESAALQDLKNIRSHVISVGGGTVVNDENWHALRDLGVTVFLETPPEEIARRLSLQPDELAKRPLLKDLVEEQDAQLQRRLLAERMTALIGSRLSRYREADLSLSDAFSTPESSAGGIMKLLVDAGYLRESNDRRHFDKWGTL